MKYALCIVWGMKCIKLGHGILKVFDIEYAKLWYEMFKVYDMKYI